MTGKLGTFAVNEMTTPTTDGLSDGSFLQFPMENGGFVIGPENQCLAIAVKWAVEGFSPKQAMPSVSVSNQPILFYGPPGSGKTHLLLGIFQKWREIHRRGKAIFLNGEEFARIFATAIASKTTDDFRQKFQKAELIVLDDLDFLQNKEAAQTEFFMILDDSREHRQTIVLSVSQFPSKRHFSDERLIARLIAGLVVPVLPLGYTARTMVLERFAKEQNLKLTPKMVQTIAQNLPGGVLQLKGFISQLVLESNHRSLDQNLVQKMLKEKEPASVPTIDEIARLISKQMGLKLADLKGKSRKSTTVKARGIAIYLTRQMTGLSLKEIGRYFGGRDHTTIAHHVGETETRLTQDIQWRDFALNIRETLLGQTMTGQ